MSESIESRLVRLGIELPETAKPAGTYVPAVRTGNLLFISGQGPRLPQGGWGAGLVGREVSMEEAREHARLCGLAVLAAAKSELGTLDRIRRVIKVFGMVRAAPEFRDHPSVINGCSDLMVELFGEAGRHARSAVGMGSLPRGISVEVEAIFEIIE